MSNSNNSNNNTLPAFVDTYDQEALLRSLAGIPTGQDSQYLVFKEGEWLCGAGADPVSSQDRWAVNPTSFKFGLVEWCGGVAGASILVPAGEPYSADNLSLQHDIQAPDHRVVHQMAVSMRCVEGGLAGTQVVYKTSTQGGVSALSDLATRIATQSRQDPAKIVPLVRLESSHYIHRKHKRKTYVPTITIDMFDDADLMQMIALTDEVLADQPVLPSATTAPAAYARRAQDPAQTDLFDQDN